MTEWRYCFISYYHKARNNFAIFAFQKRNVNKKSMFFAQLSRFSQNTRFLCLRLANQNQSTLHAYVKAQVEPHRQHNVLPI